MTTRRLAIGTTVATFLLAASCGFAAPKFQGLREARPAPGAAVLTWERAESRNPSSVRYRVLQRRWGATEWKRAAEVRGTDHVVLGLEADTKYEFLVRASDERGEDKNRRTMTVVPQAAEPAEEWRGVWVSRFEWTGGSAAEMRERLSEMMRQLSIGRFNAVVFQVRGQGDTLYPSTIEPWSPMIPEAARSFDPTRYALEQARSRGLEFHAWFNLLVIWQSAAKQHPADRNHPFWRWTNPNDPKRRSAAIHDSRRRPVFYADSNYTWLTPGNPELEVYLRRVVMDFVRRYDVDGLHWDDRTAMPNGASHDPVSLRRFAGRGNPMKIADLREWQRDQLSRLLSNIYVEATALRPNLLVSASPFGIKDKQRIAGYSRFKDCLRDFNTDAETWMRAGFIDALMPQVYWAEGDPTPNFAETVRDWVRHNRSGRPIWPGSALGNFGGEQPLRTVQARYVAFSRALGLGGNTFFSWSGAKPEEWGAVGRQFYRTVAKVPRPSHKVRPQTGQIMGSITNAEGEPIVDAWVRLRGRDYVYLSSADGFYAIPNVPLGRARITVETTSGRWPEREVTVEPGRTAVLKLQFGGAPVEVVQGR